MFFPPIATVYLKAYQGVKQVLSNMKKSGLNRHMTIELL